MRSACGAASAGASGATPDSDLGERCDTGRVDGRTSRGGVVVSPREAEVFDLVGQHLTHSEIGDRLFISARTVESHVASLRRKLGMIDHRALVRLAVESSAQLPVGALPHEASSFVGRLTELKEITTAVTASRVVSVVGPGGTGKTRLANRAASDLSAGATHEPVWVELAMAMSPSEVAPALAAALGVVEPGRRTHEQAAFDVLGQRDALVVLDNCEQVLDEVAVMVERLLAVCANVTVLLTSRIRLAVPSEQVVQMGGLDVGTTDDPGAAVDLFMARAAAAGAHLGVGERSRVVDICLALDGMPLAVELAAARVASIGIDGVEDGLGDHRSLLVGGTRVQARHRSVTDTVAWSYQLLTRLDQNVLSRVCTFHRPFSATDALAVAAYEGVSATDVAGSLGRLAQQSLIEPIAAEAGMCYRLLETVRQFGVAQLRSASDNAAAQRHLHWCALAVAELEGGEDGSAWIADVDAITEEVNGALAVTAEVQDPVASHALARQLAGLLFRRGRVTDAQNAFERAAGLADSASVEAADLALAAATATCRVAGPDALELGQRAAHKALACGDVDLAVRSIARSAELIGRFAGMFDDPPPLERAQQLLEDAKAYSAHSAIAKFTLAATDAALDPQRNLDELEDFVDRALGSGELLQASGLLDTIAARHIEDHHLVDALDACRRRLDIVGAVTSDPHSGLELKDALHTAIFTATGAGQLREAAQLAAQHARLPFLRDEPDLALEEGIAPDALAGNWAPAITAGHAFLAGWERSGRPVAPGRCIAPAALAMVHGLRGDDDERGAWLQVLESIQGDELIHRSTGYEEVFDAIVDLHHGRSEDAARRLARFRSDHFFGALFRQWHAALAAEAAVLAGHSDADSMIVHAIAATEHNPIAAVIARRARTLQGGTSEEFEGIAADMDSRGCAYQAARTRSLAGGSTAG